ncbi:MAG: hypothetical protein J2O48_10140 [Solirubrobacterales bacterium]|nr:hypothetical protein [Solirubrobacterales bacterium]
MQGGTATAHANGVASQTSGRADVVPTVWFAAHPDRGPFDQLAAVLRKRGLRVVRLVHTPASRWSKLIDKLLYHRTVTLDEFLAGHGSPDPESEDVLDVLWTEGMSQVVPDAALNRFPEHIAADLKVRRGLVNKREVACRLQAAGIPVAPHLDAFSTSDEEAVDAFGLPLMVKSDVGAGGNGVRAAGSLEQVAAAVAELDPSRTSVFFQPFIQGEVRNYAAMMGESGQPLQEAVIRQYGRSGALRTGREVVDDPELREYGRSICAELGVVGPVDLDAIHDGEHYQLVDLNVRPWNSMVSMRMAPIDFDAGYAYAKGASVSSPAHATPPPGSSFVVFPDVVDASVAQRDPVGALREFARVGRRFLPWTGVRYLVHLVALRILFRLQGAPENAGLPSIEY